MTLEQTMRMLDAAGSEQTRKIYRKHGYPVTEPLFGVSIENLQKIKKQIKTDHELAQQLWSTGNLDARLLATMIDDPTLVTSKLLDAWAKDINCYMTANLFVRNLVSKSPLARAKMQAWSKSESEFVAEAGWELVGLAAMDRQSGLSDDECIAYLNKIEAGIATAKNRAKYAMVGALIGIGARNETLRGLAESAARRIGPVDVDHGDTDCKTPEPISYLAKIWERKKTRTAGQH